MNSMTYRTVLTRSSPWARGLTLATLAVGAWGLSATSAQARDGDSVYWSIGVHQPGVSVGVSNAPPPRPVIIHQPAPVVIHQPYPYVRPVVIHQPYPYVRPVVVVHPRPVYHSGWGYGPRWDDRRDRRHDRWEDRKERRHDRWDDRRDRRHDQRWDDDDRRSDGRR